MSRLLITQNSKLTTPKGSRSAPWEYAFALAVIGLCTLLALILRSYLAAASLVMIYLIGVVGVAAKLRRGVAIFTSFLSVAAFDVFCVPPYLTFAVSDTEYLVTFAAMLGVALFISAMTGRIRKQGAEALAREAQTTALYRLSTELAGQTRVFEIMKTAAALAEEMFDCKVTIFQPDHSGIISFSKRTSDRLPVPSSDQPAAQWVFEHGEKAGKNMPAFPGASALYVPIKSVRAGLGVMAILSNGTGRSMSSEENNLLDVFVGQTALAIERTVASSSAQAAEIHFETESMRTSLLSAVSHDLRTPLATITGAAATLRSHWDRLDPAMRSELLSSVTDEADRLNRLLNNLLEVTKLESGVHLQKEAYPLEEIVGAALHRLKGRLGERPVLTEIPADLPMVDMDAVLMEQVFINLIENALKYTPVGSPVEIAARQRESVIEVEVRDHGPGFTAGHEERIFDKFFRGRTDNSRGAGLGLAISRAIVEAHGGSIEAGNRSGGGAVIRFQIPSARAAKRAL